ncbi:DNA gyrase inhibitor YacG [Hyphomicrobium sp. LHD-15]|uniref:DNA gyrase inhibitor YacG n=1 Tax=Hyphomicrobium sp. LHD-15 TaxID=3072142 RepID=UPI00280C7566|nr:DNA gyrase inhibitor YacG [Hyphomicrobium sp. LHD-15]MDQ8699849.1 DNA gyrase inhibitor YacG [Hyphomicrobium sp. LHD-15]
MNASNDNTVPGAAAGRCPICGKPAVHSVRPFCSPRCADIDLGRWVSGAYVIAGGQSGADEDGDEGFAKETGTLDRGKGSDEAS